ncbi:hypothetical protein [Streptomyces sp. NPDC051286]|uniref:hypothetical protein n=1 Tax=Streptomyces sp. NPDC051286 TaxID=3365647 RepID=UPI00379225CC
MARASFRAAVARIRHDCRSRSTAPGSALTPAPHPYGRAGSDRRRRVRRLAGLLLVGSVRTPLGPMDTRSAGSA